MGASLGIIPLIGRTLPATRMENMNTVINEIGNRYGKLVVLQEGGRSHGKAMWVCCCDCGIICEVLGTWLRRGDAISCGCSKKSNRQLSASQRIHQNEYRKRHPRIGEWRKRDKLKSKFGISLEEYNGLLQRQGGACAICGVLPISRSLAVDHDHATKRIRGLLCTKCNIALGYMNDDPEVLRKAASYLEMFS